MEVDSISVEYESFEVDTPAECVKNGPSKGCYAVLTSWENRAAHDFEHAI